MSHPDRNYPRWKYRGEEKQLVQNHKEESALGPEWTNSPADIYNPNDAPKPDPGIVDEVELNSTGTKHVSAPHYKKRKSTEFSVDEFGLENQ